MHDYYVFCIKISKDFIVLLKMGFYIALMFNSVV